MRKAGIQTDGSPRVQGEQSLLQPTERIGLFSPETRVLPVLGGSRGMMQTFRSHGIHHSTHDTSKLINGDMPGFKLRIIQTQTKLKLTYELSVQRGFVTQIKSVTELGTKGIINFGGAVRLPRALSDVSFSLFACKW